MLKENLPGTIHSKNTAKDNSIVNMLGFMVPKTTNRNLGDTVKANKQTSY